MSDTPNWLQIAPQFMQHDEALIQGNTTGLRALADALHKAADGDTSTARDMFSSDGEGYDIIVLRTERPDDFRPPFYTSEFTNQLERDNARLRRALEFLEQFYERDGETANEFFERIGDSFHKATGYLRPGKDCRMVSPGKRLAAWDKWIADGIAQVRAALRDEG